MAVSAALWLAGARMSLLHSGCGPRLAHVLRHPNGALRFYGRVGFFGSEVRFKSTTLQQPN
jgi:hypothetical protein